VPAAAALHEIGNQRQIFLCRRAAACDHTAEMGAAQGTTGLLVGYGLAVIGVVAGMVATRASRGRWLLTPLLAGPLAVAAAVLWGLALAAIPRLAPLLGSRGTAVAGAALTLAAGLLGGVLANRRPTEARVERGTRVIDPPWPTGGALGGYRARLAYAGQPVPARDETKHFKLIGSTGTGKSTAIRGLVRGALARGDRAVIADPDGAYAAEFFEPARGDLILNPFDPRSMRWDLFAELRDSYDGDLLARALIPDHIGEDRAWRGYARTLLSACLRQLARAGCRDVATLHRLITVAPVEELRTLLGATAAGPYLSEDNARFFASVRAVASVQLAPLEHLKQNAAPALSIRGWVRRDATPAARGALFLPYRASQIATLRSVVSTWMRLAIFEAMELGEGDHRLWFVVDELDALGPIDGLKDALARLRKFGGRCVLGFQSIAQVSGTYGANDAQTIVENCGNTLILRCSAAEHGGTARFASRLIGEREVLREQVSRVQGGFFEKPQRSRSVSLQRVTESAVLAAEIEQLPDLCGYLKFASAAVWLRVQMTPA
jgi:type IV secretory pathway TraG/TraD family ATPase VirD4